MEQGSYKRFLSYIYIYNEEMEKSNVGFTRVEMKGNNARIYISLTKMLEVKNPLIVALIKQEHSLNQIGRIYIKNSRAEFVHQMPTVSLESIIGILIYDEEDTKQYLMTLWKDEKLTLKDLLEDEDKEEEVLQIQEVKQEWVFPKMIIYQADGNTLEVFRIRLIDLYQLNKELIENQFLLYGYYRGRHLIFFSKEGKHYLGVPGGRPCKEEEAAKSHGFENILKGNHCFYWYREIDLGE